MSLRLIGRRPVQYVLEGSAKPGDAHITFPDAANINPAPNQYQVRPGVGMWVATLTASDPAEEIRITIQNGESATGVGSVSTCGRIENPDLWILANPARSLKQETRYVLTLTKTSPPPCVIARFWGGGRGGVKANYRPGAVAGTEAHIVSKLGARKDRGGQGRQGHRQFLLAPGRGAPTHLGLRGEAVGVALHRLTQAVWHGRATRWANRPCGDGRARHGGDVRLHGDTGQPPAGGCDYRPDPRLTAVAAGGGGVIGFTQDWEADQFPGHHGAPGRSGYDWCVAPGPVFGRVYQSGIPHEHGGSFGGSRPGTHTHGVPAVHMLQLGRRVSPRAIQRRLGSLEATGNHLTPQAVV